MIVFISDRFIYIYITYTNMFFGKIFISVPNGHDVCLRTETYTNIYIYNIYTYTYTNMFKLRIQLTFISNENRVSVCVPAEILDQIANEPKLIARRHI